MEVPLIASLRVRLIQVEVPTVGNEIIHYGSASERKTSDCVACQYAGAKLLAIVDALEVRSFHTRFSLLHTTAITGRQRFNRRLDTPGSVCFWRNWDAVPKRISHLDCQDFP